MARVGEHAGELAPRAAVDTDKAAGPSTPASEYPEIELVDRALRSVQIRLPGDRALLWRSATQLIDVFQSRPDGIVTSLQDVISSLHSRLDNEEGSATEQDVKWLKNIYFKLGVFELLGQEVGVRLRITEEAALIDRMIRGLLERIRDQAPELLEDEEVLVRGLCGDATPTELVDEMLRIKRDEFAQATVADPSDNTGHVPPGLPAVN